MNLMEMINGLNRMDDRQPFSPGAFLLAVKLIDLMNGLYWPETVSVDLGRMAVMAKCASRNATLNARNELIARGVLAVVSKGRKGSPSTYRLANLTPSGARPKPNRSLNGAATGTPSGTDQGLLNRPDPERTEKRQSPSGVAFAPPSPEEVRSYAQEAGCQVDAQRFCDFYASKGWRVGNAPMRDWRAAVRTWANRDASPPARGPKTLEQQQYTQREYTNNFDALDEMMRKYMERGQ